MSNALTSQVLIRAADLIERDGWDKRYDWQKPIGAGLSLQEAVRSICRGNFMLDECLSEVRRRIHPRYLKSIADFEDAKGRTGDDVMALLRGEG